jgi:hypothetical protein
MGHTVATSGHRKSSVQLLAEMSECPRIQFCGICSA